MKKVQNFEMILVITLLAFHIFKALELDANIRSKLTNYSHRRSNQSKSASNKSSEDQLTDESSPFRKRMDDLDVLIGSTFHLENYEEDKLIAEALRHEFPAESQSKSPTDSIDLDKPFDVISFPYMGSLPERERGPSNMIIQIDYSNLRNLSKLERVFLRIFIVPRAIEKIAGLVRVKVREKLRLKDKDIRNCNDEFITVPDYYRDKSFRVDFIVFVNSLELESDTFAMTSSCVFSRSAGRSVAANLIYNKSFLDLTKQGIEDAVETVQHEMIHAMVFDNELLKRLPRNSDGQPGVFSDDDGRRFLAGDQILRQAQDYFACSDSSLTDRLLHRPHSAGGRGRRGLPESPFREKHFPQRADGVRYQF